MSGEATTMRAVPVPDTMKHLAVDPARGVPVPWFTPWVDGKPDFRAATAGKAEQAVTKNLCWVCGRRLLGRDQTFVIGPMCLVNRNTAEPPCHLACARYSARACPFLTRPSMERGSELRPIAGACQPPGLMIKRNPGVVCLFTPAFKPVPGRADAFAPDWKAQRSGRGFLFALGEPAAVEWWAEGRTATRAEVFASVESGIPLLKAQCRGLRDEQRLAELLVAAARYFPLGA